MWDSMGFILEVATVGIFQPSGLHYQVASPTNRAITNCLMPILVH
jgi:hypothetical protein